MSDAKSRIAQTLADTRPQQAAPEEAWYQSQFLPIKTRKGEWDWGVPGIVADPWNAWTREVDSAYGIGPGVTPNQQIEDALTIGGLMTPLSPIRGGLAAGALRGAEDAVMPAAKAAEDIPFTPLEEVLPGSRLSGAQQAIARAKESGYWPDWGDRFPERALAHVEDMQASNDWNAIVQRIQAPDGLNTMDRWQAEKLAMEQAPDLGHAQQAARLKYYETAAGRQLQPSELAWHGLDQIPGLPPPAPEDLWRTVVARSYDAPGSKTGVIGGRRVGEPTRTAGLQNIARALLEKK